MGSKLRPGLAARVNAGQHGPLPVQLGRRRWATLAHSQQGLSGRACRGWSQGRKAVPVSTKQGAAPRQREAPVLCSVLTFSVPSMSAAAKEEPPCTCRPAYVCVGGGQLFLQGIRFPG